MEAERHVWALVFRQILQGWMLYAGFSDSVQGVHVYQLPAQTCWQWDVHEIKVASAPGRHTPGGYTIMSAEACLTNNGPANSKVNLLSLCVSYSSWAVGSVGARHFDSY